MLKRHFTFVAVILIFANITSTLVTYVYAGSDKSWWAVQLIVGVITSLLYALTYAKVASKFGFKKFPSGYVHIFVGILTVVLTLLFYHVPVDWLAVNSGKELPFFTKVIHSDLTPFALYLLGLLGSIVAGFTSFRSHGIN